MNFSFQRNGTFSDMSPLSRQSSTTSSSPLSIYQCTPFRHLLRQNSTTTCRVVKNSHPKPDTTSPTINLSQSSCSEFSRNLSTIMSSPTQYSESTLFSESTSVKVSVRLKSPANWTYTKDSLTINSTTYQFG